MWGYMPRHWSHKSTGTVASQRPRAATAQVGGVWPGNCLFGHLWKSIAPVYGSDAPGTDASTLASHLVGLPLSHGARDAHHLHPPLSTVGYRPHQQSHAGVRARDRHCCRSLYHFPTAPCLTHRWTIVLSEKTWSQKRSFMKHMAASVTAGQSATCKSI